MVWFDLGKTHGHSPNYRVISEAASEKCKLVNGDDEWERYIGLRWNNQCWLENGR